MLKMPKCRLQTGQNAGIRPRWCTFQTDANGVALRNRSAVATGGLPDTVTIAKQRPLNPNRKVYRRIRITYQGRNVILPNFLLDTGASVDLLISNELFDPLLPSRGRFESKWDRFTNESTLSVASIRGVVPGAITRAYQADVYLEVEIDIGRKGSGQTEFRGGPARIKITEGGQSRLVGAAFLRRHNIQVK
jgi:hypothetical protein